MTGSAGCATCKGAHFVVAEEQKREINLKPGTSKWKCFFSKYKWLNLLALVGILYFVIFKYLPMLGIYMAFTNYRGVGGIAGIFTAEFVGFSHFERFFSSVYFGRLLKNTLLISLYRIVFSFPMPIILALLINEISGKVFKKSVQTISYLPHFLSWVVVSGLISTLLSTSGPINSLITAMGGTPVYFLSDTKYFRSILIISDIWKNVGWGSIIYLATIAGISPDLYEAADLDGATRWQKICHITLPCISNTVAVMLILQVGKVLTEGFEQIFNMYNPAVYEVADVFTTYVYRIGLTNQQYSYSAAVGLFESVVSLLLVISANYFSKKLGSEGIW